MFYVASIINLALFFVEFNKKIQISQVFRSYSSNYRLFRIFKLKGNRKANKKWKLRALDYIEQSYNHKEKNWY